MNVIHRYFSAFHIASFRVHFKFIKLFLLLDASFDYEFSRAGKKRSEHLLGGGATKQQEHKKKGKLTAFDRIKLIFDSETFTEIRSIRNT